MRPKTLKASHTTKSITHMALAILSNTINNHHCKVLDHDKPVLGFLVKVGQCTLYKSAQGNLRPIQQHILPDNFKLGMFEFENCLIVPNVLR